jgi:hypothetical protein
LTAFPLGLPVALSSETAASTFRLPAQRFQEDEEELEEKKKLASTSAQALQ